MNLSALILAGVLAILGAGIGYFVSHILSSRKVGNLEKKAEELLEQAKTEGRDRKTQLDRLEDRLLKKEELLDQRSSELQRKDNSLSEESKRLKTTETEVQELRKKAIGDLEKVAGLSATEARERLFKNIEDDHRDELMLTLQKLEKNRLEEVEKKASEIITSAIQRYSPSPIAAITPPAFYFPNGGS